MAGGEPAAKRQKRAEPETNGGARRDPGKEEQSSPTAEVLIFKGGKMDGDKQAAVPVVRSAVDVSPAVNGSKDCFEHEIVEEEPPDLSPRARFFWMVRPPLE